MIGNPLHAQTSHESESRESPPKKFSGHRGISSEIGAVPVGEKTGRMGTPYSHRQVTKAGHVRDPPKSSRDTGESLLKSVQSRCGGGGERDA